MRRLLLASVLIWVMAPTGQAAPRGEESAGSQPVQLPVVLTDDFGSTWDVQYDGSIGDGGNDLYDGGGRLFVNAGNQYVAPNQQALFDRARNEVTLPPVQMGGVTVSRRVCAMRSLGCVRFVEMLENPGASPVRVQLRAYFNMGGSVQQAIPLVDEKRGRGGPVGYAIGDQSNAVAMIGGGRGSKVLPRFEYQFNNDNVFEVFDVEVPGKQTVAVVHCQLRRKTADQSAGAWRELKERDLIRDLPKDVRKRVVNWPGGDAFVGDLEVLRGDWASDVVELKGGDLLRGRLRLPAVRLQTAYGPVTLATDGVVCFLNVGTFRPVQLVVTADGDVFGGRLVDTPALELQMYSGQVTRVPLAQVTRVGFHRRPGEPDEWDFEAKRAAYLRTGERLRVKPLPAALEVATPVGPVRIDPARIASVTLAGADLAVPEVRLIDGSRLSGLLTAAAMDLPLAAAPDQVRVGPGEPSLADRMTGVRARVPMAAMARLQLAPEPDVEALAPQLTMTNGDTLVGAVAGAMSLETKFDTIRIDGAQVKGMAPAGTRGGEVRVTLWDDSTLSGRLAESHVTCRLRCGMPVRVPVPLVASYAAPLAEPSPKVADLIARVVKDLSADGYATRERAQARLIAIGPAGLTILDQARKTADTEARGRIDVIRQILIGGLDGASGDGTGGAAGGGNGGAGGALPMMQMEMPAQILIDR